MKKFLGREKKLSVLRKYWESDELACVAMYGRRRSGKTAILEEFSKDIPTIFFTGNIGTYEDNLEDLRATIAKSFIADKVDLSGNISGILRDVLECAAHQKFLFIKSL